MGALDLLKASRADVRWDGQGGVDSVTADETEDGGFGLRLPEVLLARFFRSFNFERCCSDGLLKPEGCGFGVDFVVGGLFNSSVAEIFGLDAREVLGRCQGNGF